MNNSLYESLEKTYGECQKYELKIVTDANAQTRRELYFCPVIGTGSFHSVIDDYNHDFTKDLSTSIVRGRNINETMTTTAQEVFRTAPRGNCWFDEEGQRVTGEENTTSSRTLVAVKRKLVSVSEQLHQSIHFICMASYVRSIRTNND